ncbi:MAG: F0F1 ATP synthase subunit A [Lachnospiraceae bacterium]|nr:F0F1 ATP synthase subunit A [Lachnospiraceae bacterium]
MNAIAEKLSEALEVKTVFTIPIGDGIPISESVVVMWGAMAVIVLISILLTRRLAIHPTSKRQMVAETIVTKLESFVVGMTGERARSYAPYLITVLLFLGVSNLVGLFGFKPPTKDLSVTAALALMSILLIEYAGIREKGVKKWLKAFTQPTPIITPINILELVIRPLSLCMRLFGNVLGAFIIMEMIKMLIPAVAPVPLSLYFDIFDGLIQAYIFVFLTSLFIQEAVE